MQVGAADHGDDADVGTCDLRELADLARIVGADFQHEELVVGVGCEDRQRQTDVVVE